MTTRNRIGTHSLARSGAALGVVMLVGIALRLLDIKQVPVGNMAPALVVAPVLVGLLT